MRRRTRWDLRLKIYPIIVIAAMVYLNVAPQAELTQRTAIDGDAGKLSEPVGATPINAAPQPNGNLPQRVVSDSASAGSGSAVAAPVQGIDSKGSAYVLERNPKYPVIEFVMILTDERR